ncbi:hypothetical protein QFC20_004429 [Naganishia adeliensis]|uniref:Uncharacterized protein n=1 Tax=Naganishia adeliensis TaxID=92952 RepID=A0ACC2W107_9TREE|nr:hypothetical protein QFC20_004429 [Naganishia adeliensis]
MEPVTPKVTPDAQPGPANRPPSSMPAPPQDAADSSDSDDEGPSLETMKALGRQVQPHPPAPAKIVIPKRGEKDFEPLNETVTIQEKMLPKGKSPASVFPDSATTTPPTNTSTMELLPEEALYLLERGTMQIWCHPSAYSPSIKDAQEPGFTWDDDVQGFKGTVEMSVMEGFSRFIGHQGLSLERYQVFAPRFRRRETREPSPAEEQTLSVSRVVSRARTSVGTVVRSVLRSLGRPFRWLFGVFSGLVGRLFKRSGGEAGSLLGEATATGYGALYEKLRIIPSGHSHPSSISPPSTSEQSSMNETDDPFECLLENPYLPFFHVWKPATHWTRGKWDRGSAEGLKSLPRISGSASSKIFPVLPALPTPMVRPRGTAPSKPGSTPAPRPREESSVGQSILDFFHLGAWGKARPAPPLVNTFLALKQGDRSLIVAVVDGGNVGWTRLGRGGFEEHVMVPNEMM